MEVKQIANELNDIMKEELGLTAVANEDLSNIVDVGTAIFGATDVENFTRTLVDHIGKVIFVDRKFRGTGPDIMMDGWEYGSVCEKISSDMPEFSEQEGWDLVDGQSYDPNIFYGSSVRAKFFNKRYTVEVDKSFPKDQAKSAFSSASQMSAFVSMLETQIENAINKGLDALKRRTLNNLIGETIYSEFTGGTYTGASGVRAINLFYEYSTNVDPATTLTAATCIYDPEFIRYACFRMGKVANQMEDMTTLFNVGGKERFTNKDRQKVILLSEFANAANVYLQSDTWHNDLTALPGAQKINYWQGCGTAFEFGATSKLDVDTVGGHTVTLSGVLGVIFDKEACGVANLKREASAHEVKKGRFINYFHFVDAGSFNDLDENCAVFFVA